MGNADQTKTLTYMDIYRALDGTASNPAGIADAAERVSFDMRAPKDLWIRDQFAEVNPLPDFLRECAAAIRLYDGDETLHQAIKLRDRNTGAEAICILLLEDGEALMSPSYKCTPNDVTGYILAAPRDRVVDGEIMDVRPYTVHIIHEPSETERVDCTYIRKSCEHPVMAVTRNAAAKEQARYILEWLTRDEAVTYEVFDAIELCECGNAFDFEVARLDMGVLRDTVVDSELVCDYDEFRTMLAYAASLGEKGAYPPGHVAEHRGINYAVDYGNDRDSFQGPEAIDRYLAWEAEHREALTILRRQRVLESLTRKQDGIVIL